MTADERAKQIMDQTSALTASGLEASIVRAIRAAEEAMKERCARAAETWGNAPPNPEGRRARLAATIRALECP